MSEASMDGLRRGLASYIYSCTNCMAHMRTVQMTLDDKLVQAVDGRAKHLGTTRSAFTRRALTDALERLRVEALEQRHRRGYGRRPTGRGEFTGWDREHSWPD